MGTVLQHSRENKKRGGESMVLIASRKKKGAETQCEERWGRLERGLCLTGCAFNVLCVAGGVQPHGGEATAVGSRRRSA